MVHTTLPEYDRTLMAPPPRFGLLVLKSPTALRAAVSRLTSLLAETLIEPPESPLAV